MSLPAEWEYALRSVAIAVSTEVGALREVDHASREDQLCVAAYPATAHAAIVSRKLVRKALTGWNPPGVLRVVIVACDFSEPDVGIEEVSAVTDTQVPQRILRRHPMRVRTLESFKSEIRGAFDLALGPSAFQLPVDVTREVVDAPRSRIPRRSI